MNMKLFIENTEDVEILTECVDDKAPRQYFIKGVFLQANIKNRNGRVYPASIMEREVNRYTNANVLQNRAFGELGHPNGPTINLDRVSHLIVELYKDGDNFPGKAKIMDTPNGKIVKALIDEQAKLGVSSRGMGSLKTVAGVDQVQSDFYLATAADIVADPSAPDAFVRGIMEGKEWVWENGLLKEFEIQNIKDTINPIPSIKGIGNRVIKESEAISAFKRFLNELTIGKL